jgi:hypothetical protein
MFIIQHFLKSARGNHCNFIAASAMKNLTPISCGPSKAIEIFNGRKYGILFVIGMEELGLPKLPVKGLPLQPPGFHLYAPIETQFVLIQKGTKL